MSGCQRFKENAWRRELCGDCLRPRGEHGAPSSDETPTLNGSDKKPDTNVVFSGSSSGYRGNNAESGVKKSSPVKSKLTKTDGAKNVARNNSFTKQKISSTKLSEKTNTSSPPQRPRSNSKPAPPVKGAHLKNLKIDQSPPRNRTRSNSGEKKVVARATAQQSQPAKRRSALKREARILGKLCSVKFRDRPPEVIGEDGGLNGSSDSEEDDEEDDDIAVATVKLTPREKEIAQLTFDNTKFNSKAENLLQDKQKPKLEKMGSNELLAIEDEMLWHPKSFSTVTDRTKSPPPSNNQPLDDEDEASSLSLSEANNDDGEETNSDHDTVSSTEGLINFPKKRPSLSAHRFKKQPSSESTDGATGIYHDYDISVRDRSSERDTVTTVTDTKQSTNLTRAYKVVDIAPVKKVAPYKVIDIAENVPEKVSSPEEATPPKLPTSTPPTSDSSRQGSVTPRGVTPEKSTKSETPKNLSFLHDSTKAGASVAEVEAALKILKPVNQISSSATPTGTIHRSATVERRTGCHTTRETGSRRSSYGRSDESPSTPENKTISNPVILYAEKEKLRQECASPRKVPIMIRHHMYEDIDSESDQQGAAAAAAQQENFYDLYDAANNSVSSVAAKTSTMKVGESSTGLNQNSMVDLKPTTTDVDNKRTTIGSSQDLAKMTKLIKRPAPAPPAPPSAVPTPPPTSTLPRPAAKKDLSPPSGAAANQPDDNNKESSGEVVVTTETKSKSRYSGRSFFKKLLSRGNKEKEYNFDMIGSSGEVAGDWTVSSHDFDDDDEEIDEFSSDSEEEFEPVNDNNENFVVKDAENLKSPEVAMATMEKSPKSSMLTQAITRTKERCSLTQKEARASNPVKKRASFTKDDISAPQPIERIKSVPGLIDAGPSGEPEQQNERPRSLGEESLEKCVTFEIGGATESENKIKTLPITRSSLGGDTVHKSVTLGRGIRKPPAPPPPIPRSQQSVISSSSAATVSKRIRPPPPPLHRPFSTLEGANKPERPPPPTRISSVENGRSLLLLSNRRRESAPSNITVSPHEDTNHTYETLPDELEEDDDEIDNNTPSSSSSAAAAAENEKSQQRIATRLYEPVIFPRNNGNQSESTTITTATPIRQHAYELIGGENNPSSMVTEKPTDRRNSTEGYLTPFKTIPRQYYNTNSLNRRTDSVTPGNDKPKNDQIEAVENNEIISSSWENLFAVLDVGGPSGTRKMSLPSNNAVDNKDASLNTSTDSTDTTDSASMIGCSATMPHRRPPPRSESLREKPTVSRVESLRASSGDGASSSGGGVLMRRDSVGATRRRRNRDSLPEQYVLIYKQQSVNKSLSNGAESRSNSIDSSISDDSEYVDMSRGRRGHRLPEGANITDVQTIHESVSRLNLDTLRNMFHNWLKTYSSNQQVYDVGRSIGWGNFVLHATENVINTSNAIYYSAHLRDNEAVRCTLRVSRQPICPEMDEISHPIVVVATQRFNSVIPSQFLPSDNVAMTTDVVGRAYVTVLPFERMTLLTRHLLRLQSENLNGYFCEICTILIQILHYSISLSEHRLVFQSLNPDCVLLTDDLNIFVEPSHISSVAVVTGDPDEDNPAEIICKEIIGLILKLLEVDTFATLNDPLEFLYKKTVFKITQLLNCNTLDCLQKCVETLAFVLWGPSEPLITASQAPPMDEIGMQLWLDVERARIVNKIVRKKNCNSGEFFYRLEFVCGITRLTLVKLYESFLEQIS